MAADDVYELIHQMSYEGQAVLNVYFFQNISGGENAQDIVDQYAADRVTPMKSNQSDAVSHVEVRARNLFDSGDVGDTALSGTGASSGVGADWPSFISVSFKMEHPEGSVRPGFKRILLGNEDNQDEGVWEATALATWQTDIGDPLENPLAWATDWEHVVVGRILDAGQYRLPESQAEMVLGPVLNVTAQVNVTTQNSRKWYT